MACEGFSSSTISLKIGVLALLVVLVLHIVGVALPRWSTLDSGFSVDGVGGIDSDYHVGLWRDCSCVSVLGHSTCICVSKQYVTGALRTVQGLETIGLIGLIISGITSLVLMFGKGARALKGFNIAIVFGSGIAILVGVVVYGVVCNDDYDHLFSYIDTYLDGLNMDTNPARLTTSFILCTVAGVLCVLLCTGLLIADYRSSPTIDQPAHQLQSMPVHHQGQIIAAPPGQVIVQNVGQQPGYAPYVGQMQYGQPPAYTQQSAYTQQYQPAPMHGVPYKA